MSKLNTPRYTAVTVLSAVVLCASDPARAEPCAGNFVERVMQADSDLATARSEADGEKMVDALSTLVALEKEVSECGYRAPRTLTTFEDFADTASLAAGDADLVFRFQQLVPRRHRGLQGGASIDTVSLSSTMPIEMSLVFKPLDPAMVYVRGGANGALSLTVSKPGEATDVCKSMVQNGPPICSWTAGEDGQYKILIETLQVEPQFVQVLIN